MDPETKKLVHDPETAVYARLIADEALSGKALVHVARLLNTHGVESPRGGEWNSSSVMQLLRAPAFAGLMPLTECTEAADGTRKYSSKVVPYRDPVTLDTVSIGEGIITVGERELIIRQLESRTFPLAGKRHGHKQGTSLLTGIARCGLCGSRMSKAGTSYACASNRMGRGCGGVSVRVETLDVQSTGADAVDRYNRLAGRLRGRIDGLRADLASLPTPAVDLTPLLDGVLLREAWEADDVTGRRERLRLAIDRVEVSKGRVGVRFDGDERCRIAWAESAGRELREQPGTLPAVRVRLAPALRCARW
ncbi:recombinase family protein [Streptomyces javensis]|uniref:recombinase family protein n=1 Tax=Streptomyces javensis TaxID=114698 RepID=UPI0033E5B236